MAANAANIEVIQLPKDTKSPECPHGPTLLFERYDSSNKVTRQFYACSAFRDRKACSFFQWADSSSLSETRHGISIKSTSTTHKQARRRYRLFRKLPRKQRDICCSCGLLLLDGEVSQHQTLGHEIKRRVGFKDLKHPSVLFSPLDDNKTYAQYLFSKSAVDFVLSSLICQNFTHVLCVGTPRIHEGVQCLEKNGKTSLSSMLLDLDDRYAQLYPPDKFSKYNMFNHHFFEQKGKQKVSDFMSSGGSGVVLVTDPPFGGMVEALATSFKELSNMSKISRCAGENMLGDVDTEDYNIPIIWMFPYFLESRILSHYPGMTMLDYKVDYDNHPVFRNPVKKKGSPVRIFTNISPSLFKLPVDEGYWFCEKCQRYSAQENKHCTDCAACTSKDGTTYIHCDVCMRCVKPSRVHCFTCQMCQLKDHLCGKAAASGCHICGELDHKRRQCPQKTEGSNFCKRSAIKRKGGNKQNGNRSKKKRRS